MGRLFRRGCGRHQSMFQPRTERSAHNVVIIPNPKMPVPMMGMIQWIRACADHPYQLTQK